MATQPAHLSLPVALDRTSPVPMYHQIVEQVSAAIAAGTLQPGDVLEREDLLARRLEISRPTLRRALGSLSELGLISRSRGVGTTVSVPASEPSPTSSRESVAPAARTSRILRLDPECVDARAAAELGVDERSSLVYVEKLIVFEGGSVAVQRTWLPAGVVNPIARDLAATPIRTILRDSGHAIASEKRTFRFRTADDLERNALGADAGEICEVCAVGYDEASNVVQVTISSFLEESEAQLLAS